MVICRKNSVYANLLAICLLAFSPLLLLSEASAGSYRENQLSAALREQITVGQAIDLPLSDNSSFLAFYTEAFTPKSRGCVLLLHGLQAHLDWPQIIGPLRTQFPVYGWNTLSIQLATLGNFTRIGDYQTLYRNTESRLLAAIDFLEKKGIYNIVLVGHSLGGSMGLFSLASLTGERKKAIIAFVGIAMYDPQDIASDYRSSTAIAKLKIPVLDIYGALDSANVLQSVGNRKIAAAKAGFGKLSQVALSGGDHFLTGLEKSVEKRIRVWADKQAPSMELELNRTRALTEP